MSASRWTTYVSSCPDYHLYLYYDDDCNGSGKGGEESGWIISDAMPDRKAISDLDNDGSCDNYLFKATGVSDASFNSENPAGAWDAGEWVAKSAESCEAPLLPAAGGGEGDGEGDGEADISNMAFKFSTMCEETTDAKYKWGEWVLHPNTTATCGGIARARQEVELDCLGQDASWKGKSGCACHLVNRRKLRQQTEQQADCRQDIYPVVCYPNSTGILTVGTRCSATAQALNGLEGVNGVACADAVQAGATGVLVVDTADSSTKFATLAKLNDLMYVDGVQFSDGRGGGESGSAGAQMLTVANWKDGGAACGKHAQDVVAWLNAALGLQITTSTTTPETTSVLFTAVARTSRTTRDPSLGYAYYNYDDEEDVGESGDGGGGGGGGGMGQNAGGINGGGSNLPITTTTAMSKTSAADGPSAGMIAGIIGGIVFVILAFVAVSAVRRDSAANKLLIEQVRNGETIITNSMYEGERNPPKLLTTQDIGQRVQCKVRPSGMLTLVLLLALNLLLPFVAVCCHCCHCRYWRCCVCAWHVCA